MSKHTNGPWEAYNSQGGVIFQRWRVASRGKTKGISIPVAIVTNEDAGIPGDEQAANARLIASAPEMLAALRRLEIAARVREHIMGDPCSLLAAKAELAAAAKHASFVISKATQE